jgi:phosphate-selective porin OprO/OprP
MKTGLGISAVAVSISMGWASPVLASAKEDAAMRRELAAMRAQMAVLAVRVDSLEGQLDTAKARVEAAEARAAMALAQAEAVKAAAPPTTASAKPATEITWDAGPKLATKDGWSFKPRGRMQLDVAEVDAPAGIAGQTSLGIATEFRRAYLGVDGTMPGGFGYRIEADLANSSVDLTDVYLTWKASPKFTVTVGQHKPFQSMEDMTSDLFTSFLERAAFNSAFGF